MLQRVRASSSVLQSSPGISHSLADAQEQIRTNWITAYQKYIGATPN
jgi:hypothetical protein